MAVGDWDTELAEAYKQMLQGEAWLPSKHAYQQAWQAQQQAQQAYQDSIDRQRRLTANQQLAAMLLFETKIKAFLDELATEDEHVAGVLKFIQMRIDMIGDEIAQSIPLESSAGTPYITPADPNIVWATYTDNQTVPTPLVMRGNSS